MSSNPVEISFQASPRMSTRERIDRVFSGVMFWLCVSFAAFVLFLLVLVVAFLMSRGLSSISWTFFSQPPSGDPAAPGGMLNAIVGTITLVTLASIVGIPMGILTGVFLSEYEVGSRIAAPVRFISDVLAGVPSIVVGILGYELLVVPFSSGKLLGVPVPMLQSLGIKNNAWAGALALAFIMIPIVARTTEEMLRLVPDSYRQASIALGANKATTILKVVLPSATGSIVTGVMLAIARIAGETAPLIFTVLGSRLIPFFNDQTHRFMITHWRDLNEPFPSLTKQVYDYATGPYPEQKNLAMAGILVLIALIFVVNVSIRLVARRQK